MTRNIDEILEDIVNENEANKWIKEFRSYKGIFAVLRIGGASLQKYPKVICKDLAILYKLKLIIPVVYGWGDAFTEKLRKNGIETKRHEKTGVRITKKEDIPHLKDIANEQGNIIVNGLKSAGVLSEIVYDVFSAKKMDLEGVHHEHYTGEVTTVDHEKIKDYVKKQIIPLIPPIGYSKDGQLLNIDGDSAAKHLVLSLIPKRYIIITNTGGVLDNKLKIISEISISKDYDRLVRNGIVSGRMKSKLNEAKEVIEKSISKLDVQIASQNNLLLELFTKGAGTYIRK